MRWLFLRGEVPTDRPKEEIVHSRLEDNDCMWIHLFHELMRDGDTGEVVYFGGKREHSYNKSYTEKWVNRGYTPAEKPDIIFARGGLPVYDKSLKRLTDVYKIYYGAGKRYLPESDIQYDCVLVDDERQLRKAEQKGFNARIWNKPPAPLFGPKNVSKYYDVCYVADGRFKLRAKIKGVKWMYRTVPEDLKVLHLGWSGKYTPPENVTVKRVLRNDVPFEMSKCRIGMVPYTTYDSAPRVIPEMSACGLPIVASNEVRFASKNYPNAIRCERDEMWRTAKMALNMRQNVSIPNNSVKLSAEYIRSLI